MRKHITKAERLKTEQRIRDRHEDRDDYPTPICKVTGTYCTGRFCDDYGCAKECGIYDDEEDDYL